VAADVGGRRAAGRRGASPLDAAGVGVASRSEDAQASG